MKIVAIYNEGQCFGEYEQGRARFRTIEAFKAWRDAAAVDPDLKIEGVFEEREDRTLRELSTEELTTV